MVAKACAVQHGHIRLRHPQQLRQVALQALSFGLVVCCQLLLLS
jgi:hypothetical protein